MRLTLPIPLLALVGAVAAEDGLNYGRDVLPILSEKCFACHGPDETTNDADLRLDTREGATADLGGYAALVPGKPEESEIVFRIESEFEDEVMPPPDSHLSLSAEEKATLKRWIAEGGEYEAHWAFVAPEKPEAGDIDQLVDLRLAKAGMSRAPRASLETLVRRIHLDLVGLPPSPAEIDSFLEDAAGDEQAAVERRVDDLLEREAFAEKWARHWLDIARYADSNGFEKDMPREQWAWRDWVIGAIDKDMPYDRFLIEQVAGDMLPNRTQDQMVASGFMRNGMVNEEGAIVYEQFRIEGVFDRMDALGKAAVGLTLQCAQCHTHKFDPITHDEYFGMFAFLNDTFEAQSWVYTPGQQEKIESIEREIAAIEERIRERTPDWKERVERYAAAEREREAVWETLDPIEHVWEGGLNHPEKVSDRSVLVLGHPTTQGKMFITAKPESERVTAVRIEALRHGDLPFGGPGRSYRGMFAISELEVAVKRAGEEKWQDLELGAASADFAEEDKKLGRFFLRGRNKGKTEENRRVGPAKYLIDDDRETAWRPDRGPVLRHAESVAMVELAEPLVLWDGDEIRVRMVQDHGGDGGIDNQQLGRFRVGVTGVKEPALAPHDHAATLALGADDEESRAKLFRAWRLSEEEFKEDNQAIAKLESGYPQAPTSVLHQQATEPRWDRETRLLDRGVWNQPKHVVEPHVPEVLHPLEVEDPDRLDFARWLADARNPMVARLQVNRVWQAFFGSGLVETSEDFGTRAPRPEHLEVLDWLSVDFVEHGWSLKHLVRRIATSETYQQDSAIPDKLLEYDPNNRLLARGPRFRAEAEVIRDIALSAAGLLHRDVGGPSIFPPVPQSVLDDNFFKPTYWEPAEPPQRYRRSLYVFRKRSMPDPVLSNFDAPTSDFSCARRPVSNTPLAALVSLNEPVFVEAAQGLALRILREAGPSFEERVDYGYRLTTGRRARPAEADKLAGLVESQRQRLADGWLPIHRIAFPDPENPPQLPEGVSPREVAEWTLVSRILLNLDQTLTKY